MAVQGGEDVYASLLLTDSYLPGALVLAHSLRDAGTSKKLAILVTLDSVSADVITQLKNVYDYVIPVPRIQNPNSANLYLMGRPDLYAAFTKINLWKQTQFRRIVYVDADVVAYRAPDELFDLPHDFAAAPDIGWPDLFNSGVMALRPNMGDYYALTAMAERGISFDSADQGLLNMHFNNSYHRLSFTYNVTPSAHYQYVPAYRHFQSNIRMVHFIGAEKPWIQGRDKTRGTSPFDEMAGRWWAVYDRHYRLEALRPSSRSTSPPSNSPKSVQHFVKDEYQAKTSYIIPVGEPFREQIKSSSHGQQDCPPVTLDFEHRYPSAFQKQSGYYERHEKDGQEYQHSDNQLRCQPPGTSDASPRSNFARTHHQNLTFPLASAVASVDHQHHNVPHIQNGSSVLQNEQPSSCDFKSSKLFRPEDGHDTEARKEQKHGIRQWNVQPRSEPGPEVEPAKPPPMETSWDAQRQPPPSDSKPEAANFPQMHYDMSSDTAPFVPPPRYPSPPRNMWYEVPKEAPPPPTQKPKAIFPWETHQPRASRIFVEPPFESENCAVSGASGEGATTYDSRHQDELSSTRSSSAEHKSEPQTPTTPTIRITPSNPWASFSCINAWDEMPEIDRYMERTMLKHRRTKSAGLKMTYLPEAEFGTIEDDRGEAKRGGPRSTDFPHHRLSLPVTPAPVRRPRSWGGGGPRYGLQGDEDKDGQLPAAQGVPAQADWDPAAQLQKLAKQPSELLLQRLGGAAAQAELPTRPLPFGSENSKSPTYVAPAAASSASPAHIVGPTPANPPTPKQMLPSTEQGASAKTMRGIGQHNYHGPGGLYKK